MKEKRRRYLHNTSIEDALNLFFQKGWQETAGETVEVTAAVGRVTAQAVFAKISSPHYHAAAMDGVAVRSQDTVGAAETAPKRLRLNEQAFPVDTGNALPAGCDAVIMAEDITEFAEEVEITASVAPWQHVRPIGEDIVATEMLLPAGHRLSGVDAGALLAGGITQVEVRKQPKVTVIPTGNELVTPGTPPGPGQIIEYNSTVFSALVSEWGGEPLRHDIVRDNFDQILEAVANAAQNSDVVLINAGSSAGRRDYTADVVAQLGEVLVHGVAVRPGKPVILGVVEKTPVIGVPGYPVSAVVALEIFLKPLLYRLQGLAEPARPTLRSVFSRQVTSPLSAEEWVRVKVGRVGERYVATPLSRGSGVITSLVRADGIVRIPQQKEGLVAGEEVDVELLRAPDHIDRTVVCIGSHDLTLDILGDLLSRTYPGHTLSSAHVGSTGGIMALRRKEAHLAGVHLLHEETGQYNIPFLKQFLPDVPVTLVTLVEREQGLMVPAGNPKGIADIEDLTRPDVSFVNRQRGAGTRLLLDARLKEKGISAEAISGYDREEYTHLSVAAAVAAGSADTGLGVAAAAKSLGLDFIPLAKERYDLAIPQASLQDENVIKLLEVARSTEFKQTVDGLDGYHTDKTGEIAYQGE
ncbi:molybdopterin biosynthesis protein [Dethiobacter alkaliphilus]|uniref:Molybdopterin molybdenumtransferase n=1 Tax=Dethiobacter alkaliphilus AHT 1 TaxID=555088 RepID=C0GH93_DETAL|nr:molybdopterin biosynthesis protein [Dethiobacter alkaliphilus]EEG77395.1 molybdenum cofactor synthesis domain protein [Dethiobacter alkaliphilus AHT 1]